MKKLNRLLLATIFSLGLISSTQCLAQAQEPSVVYVTGYAEKELVPDMAFVTLGMETSSDKLDTARNENASAMNRLVEALQRLGLDKTQLTTKNYRIMPRHDKNGEKINGYSVNNSLEVKVINLQLLPKVLEAAGENGINQVHQVRFSCSNMSAHKAELLQTAIANGRFLAKAAASAAGGQLGKIKELHVNGNFPSFSNTRLDETMLLKANAVQVAPVLEQGIQKASESVDMVFYIE